MGILPKGTRALFFLIPSCSICRLDVACTLIYYDLYETPFVLRLSLRCRIRDFRYTMLSTTGVGHMHRNKEQGDACKCIDQLLGMCFGRSTYSKPLVSCVYAGSQFPTCKVVFHKDMIECPMVVCGSLGGEKKKSHWHHTIRYDVGAKRYHSKQRMYMPYPCETWASEWLVAPGIE